MQKSRIGAWVASVALIAGTASAESVTLVGNFPAAYREASFLERLAVDRFDGNDGTALSIALERALSGNGGPAHFSITSMSRRSGVSPADADGTLSGVVSTEVNENRETQRREECVEKVDSKCTKKQQIEVICRRRTIDVIADLRIARTRDGSIAYSNRKTRQNAVTWCPTDNAPGPVEGIIRGMIDTIAAETAREIAPYTERYAVRFYETRSGMPKDIGNDFKAAIKQTQRDLPGACQAFAAIDSALPDHVSVVYDLGVCAEARGEFETAMALYQRAAAIRPRDRADFDIGVDRTQRLIAARNDDRERERRQRR